LDLTTTHIYYRNVVGYSLGVCLRGAMDYMRLKGKRIEVS